jgi:PadR family transcriptional regulator, phenolic acid-responsive transcriptional regulator
MRLKPSSYLILGMLNQGKKTGYAIKRAVDRSTRFFWAASLAQVYPELAALEQDGYVISADEPHGARPRKTDRDFRTEILPFAQAAGVRFPLIAAREGADYFSWRAAWFRGLEAEMADELDRRGR